MQINEKELEIKERDYETMEEINLFYKTAGYNGEAQEQDRIFLAKYSSELICVVRICLEEKTYVLRGMNVRSDFHGKGVGRHVFKFIYSYLKRLPSPCYAIPYDYLLHFYNSIGFNEVLHHEAPKFLQDRLLSYKARGLKVKIIKF